MRKAVIVPFAEHEEYETWQADKSALSSLQLPRGSTLLIFPSLVGSVPLQRCKVSYGVQLHQQSSILQGH